MPKFEEFQKGCPWMMDVPNKYKHCMAHGYVVAKMYMNCKEKNCAPYHFTTFGTQVASIGPDPEIGAISHDELDAMQPPLHDHPEIADVISRLIQADTILTEVLVELQDGLKATSRGEMTVMGQFWLALSFMLLDRTRVDGLCDLVEDLRTWKPSEVTMEDEDERKHEQQNGPEVM